MSVTPVLQPFYEVWATHQRRLLAAKARYGGVISLVLGANGLPGLDI